MSYYGCYTDDLKIFPEVPEHGCELDESQGSVIYYVGSVETGDRGEVKRILFAINELVKSGRTEKLPVTIECHDIGIKVVSGLTQKVLFEHAYMKISSCGSSTSEPLYFAYITGDDDLTKCQKFICHIFRSRNKIQVKASRELFLLCDSIHPEEVNATSPVVTMEK